MSSVRLNYFSQWLSPLPSHPRCFPQSFPISLSSYYPRTVASKILSRFLKILLPVLEKSRSFPKIIPQFPLIAFQESTLPTVKVPSEILPSVPSSVRYKFLHSLILPSSCLVLRVLLGSDPVHMQFQVKLQFEHLVSPSSLFSFKYQA